MVGGTQALIEWAKWIESADRNVKTTVINDDITISTVFLALDYNHLGHLGGEPLLFETMVLRNGSGCEMICYTPVCREPAVTKPTIKLKYFN